MTAVPLHYYLIVSGIIFTIGVIGVLTRRNLLVVIMCIEMMLNAVNLTLVAFSRFLDAMDGQICVFLVMAVAAAEVAVGLALILALFRKREMINLEDLNIMKW